MQTNRSELGELLTNLKDTFVNYSLYLSVLWMISYGSYHATAQTAISPHGVDDHKVSPRQTQQSSVEANIEDVIAKADLLRPTKENRNKFRSSANRIYVI